MKHVDNVLMMLETGALGQVLAEWLVRQGTAKCLPSALWVRCRHAEALSTCFGQVPSAVECRECQEPCAGAEFRLACTANVGGFNTLSVTEFTAR
jgi:hypothetical protein